MISAQPLSAAKNARCQERHHGISNLCIYNPPHTVKTSLRVQQRSFSLLSLSMDYRNSSVMKIVVAEVENLCADIPLRISNNPQLEVRGIQRAQDDWRTYFGPLEAFNGAIGDRFNFMAVCLPECLPERLEILSYANEFGFLHDGKAICVLN